MERRYTSMDKYAGLNVFYSPELHDCLITGKTKKDKGLYIVIFKSLKSESDRKDQPVLVYNQVFYPSEFLNCLIGFLIFKSNFKDSNTFKDWGDYLTIIDSYIDDNQNVLDMLENKTTLNEYFTEYIHSEEFTKHYDDFRGYGLFDLLKKRVHSIDIDGIIANIDLINKKNYEKAFGSAIDFDMDWSKFNNIYLLKDTICVVKDLRYFLDGLKKLGYNVHRGPKNARNQLTASNSFLSALDSDFRNSLYKHHLYCVKNGHIPRNCLLPRSKFSYENIHINICKNLI